ncbi:hypothetical protein M011DRAFT_406460 [Sporormia fimetaria CBS 119925]|uniref:LYC1 C-terminal domain-containing protein n=1 Tax=Sporormia fimetaria CBS 119925 TaxID=1340428 RepID=A0A6A6V6E5_9PLEO|nr:hypothetical protein M011DRAFT_406460 [Sporormia fimetaria CBS 119925]
MASIPNLPPGTAPTLALVHPTEQEKQIQFRLNSVEWRGALSPEAYLHREAELSKQELTRDGGITYWILVDTAQHNALNPTSKSRLPLASCETYRKRALVWRDGKVQEIISHGIGSVFCAPHLRKKGYAGRMLQELGTALKTHQTEDKECLFSILYSDIGKKFYAGFGWEPFNSSHVAIPGTASDRAAGELPAAQPLYAEDLQELCELDESLLRKELESRSEGSRIAVALVPDIQTIRWHHVREDFVAAELHGKPPKVKGAIVGSEKGKRAWCYWTRMWGNENPQETKGNTFHILRFVVEENFEGDVATAKAAMLSMAQKEAQEWGLEHVEAWNPSPDTVAAAQKLYPQAEVVDRDTESITCLQWFPEHSGNIAESIDWVSNEKYGWC